MLSINGRIKEIRSSADGDYDWASNCWESTSVLIVTDEDSFAFVCFDDNEKDKVFFRRLASNEYSLSDYPYVLRRYSSRDLSINEVSYDGKWLENIFVDYEDVQLWIAGDSMAYVLFSVHIVDEDQERSNYLPWDDLDDYLRIEFDMKK